MDATAWIDLQEALLWFFSPVLNGLFIVLLAGGILSALGAVILGLSGGMAR
jgi:hypothetical protein